MHTRSTVRTFHIFWESLQFHQLLSTRRTQKRKPSNVLLRCVFPLHQQGTSGDCIDLDVALFKEECQQVCGSPAEVCFFSNALAQKSIKATCLSLHFAL